MRKQQSLVDKRSPRVPLGDLLSVMDWYLGEKSVCLQFMSYQESEHL